MIGFLSGRVLECSEGKVLLGVGSPVSGDAGGVVGYSLQTFSAFLAGERADLFVYTHVREDALDLYGFRTAVEKDLFLTLLSVSGIGPRLALGILSGAEAGELVQAILREDKAFLSRIPGIGKKTAERLVLELGDKIRKKADAGFYASLKGASAPAGAAALPGGAAARGGPGGRSALVRDAASALVGLGYKDQLATDILQSILNNTEPAPARVEDLIRLALRQLS